MRYSKNNKPSATFDYSTRFLSAPPTSKEWRTTTYIINHPYRSYMIALALGVALSVGNAWAQDALPEIRQQGDISYISGGVGSDENDAMNSVKNAYNLRITSADVAGHFHGDTRIIIGDQKQMVLLDTTTQGPLFYTNLPKGRYTVQGFSDGQSKTKTVNIVPGKVSRVNFSWANEVAEISEDARLRSDMNLSHDSY